MKRILACSLIAAAAAALAAPQRAGDIPVAGPVRWDYVWLDPASHRLYVAHSTQVDIIDTDRRQVVAQLAPTPGVHGAVAATDLHRIFTSNGADDSLGVFDLATGKPVQTVAVGKGPDAIAYDPLSRRVFTFNGRSSDVTVVDADSLKVLAVSVPVGGRPEYAVGDGNGHIYFNVENTSEIAVLDARSMTVVRRYGLAPCEEPSGLAIDPHRRLYSVCDNGLLVVSDPDRGRVIGQADIGRGPDGVAWMDGKAYSANGADGTISVVAETSPGRFKTIETVTTALGARTIAADPQRHELYLPTADFPPQPPASAASGRRPPATPGTFRVLVVREPDGAANPAE